MRQAIKGVLAAFLLAGASGAAWAVPAIVETDLNVRSGPSTGYPVLDTMPAGATVDVVACYSGWCEIVWDGFGGFASRAYLAITSGVTVIEPPAGAIVAPGIVVYEARYFERPIWTSRGHIIRQAIRRDIRRHIRQDRREDRREVRQERREDRRELRRDRREERREVRQERRERRAEPARNVRREIRRAREDRAQAIRERPRRMEDSRRNVERRSLTNSRARVQEQQQRRREVRQQRRHEAAQAREQRERKPETSGRR
jgi:uncharacterized protein YraI